MAPGLAYDRLHFEMPRTFFNYAGHGGLGMGYCVGLGTKLGRPDRPAVSLQGDGGFLYTSQEINTAVRWSIPLVSIVLNNSCHGAEKAQQQRHFGASYIGVDLVNPRFDKLAEVYGARGMYVQRPDEIADAVRTRSRREWPGRDRDSGRRILPGSGADTTVNAGRRCGIPCATHRAQGGSSPCLLWNGQRRDRLLRPLRVLPRSRQCGG